jgi:hypothetical protein
MHSYHNALLWQWREANGRALHAGSGKILAFGSFECTLNFRFLGILRWIDERNECLEEE